MDSTRMISRMEYFGGNAYYTRNNNGMKQVKDHLKTK